MEEILNKIANIRQDQSSEAKWKRKCLCGYDPHNESYENSEKCNVKIALQNHLSFPSFQILSEYDMPSTLYWDLDSGIGVPIQHWALIFQIERDIGLVRPGCLGVTYYGEKVSVHFYHERNDVATTFSWNDLKKGNTMVILYAEKKTFLDGSEGVRQETLDHCYIFHTNIDNLFREANKLLNDADLSKNPESVCFGCGLKTNKIFRCASCHKAKYCSKTCQVNEWKLGHKNICKQSDMLLRLTCLPRHEFQEFFTFKSI